MIYLKVQGQTDLKIKKESYDVKHCLLYRPTLRFDFLHSFMVYITQTTLVIVLTDFLLSKEIDLKLRQVISFRKPNVILGLMISLSR